MSLCIAFFQNNRILVCADGRVSIQDDNKKYYKVHDNCQKIRQYSDKVLFLSGNLETTDYLFDYLKNNDSIEQIRDKVQAVYNQFDKKWPDEELGAYIFTIEDGIAVMYQMSSDTDFAIDRQERSVQSFAAVAAHSDEAIEYLSDIFAKGTDKDVLEVILDTYEHFADEMVGGYMNYFNVIPEGINEFEKIKIKDYKNLSVFSGSNYKYHCTMDGRLLAQGANVQGSIDCSSLKIAGTNILDTVNKIQGDYLSNNSVGASKLKVNELYVGSGGIRLDSSAVISWGQVNSKPFIPSTASDVGALPVGTYIPTVPSYITSTKITGTSIESCTITGNNIIGGTITSGTVINVGTNCTIGDYLYMNPVNFGGGIVWNNVAEIYIDPVVKKLIVTGTNSTQIGSYGGNTIIRGNVTFPDSSIVGVAKFG